MILVACEESQTVCKAFRDLGHEAYSCDIQPCSGGYPEWHIQDDVVKVLHSRKWDIVIAHPPCTDLAASGAKWFAKKIADNRQQAAIDFFLMFTKLECLWAIENPVGIMSKIYRKPDQYVQPYWFGHKTTKKTGLWLNGLPPLTPTNLVDPSEGQHIYADGRKDPLWHYETMRLPPAERKKARSKTFVGLAKAMAVQWGQL